MGTGNLKKKSKVWPLRVADNLTAIDEPIA
jgi:hypothetical protein